MKNIWLGFSLQSEPRNSPSPFLFFQPGGAKWERSELAQPLSQPSPTPTMNHLEGAAEVKVTDEAAGGEVNESVEADLEHPEVEEEQQQQQHYAGRPRRRRRAIEDPRAQPGHQQQQQEDEHGECLARSD